MHRVRFFGRAILLARAIGHAPSGNAKAVGLPIEKQMEMLLFVFYYLSRTLRENCPNTEFFLVRIGTLFTQWDLHFSFLMDYHQNFL